MGVICGVGGGDDNISIAGGRQHINCPPPPPTHTHTLFSFKFYITYAGNEAINNIIKYILNTNKYKINQVIKK